MPAGWRSVVCSHWPDEFQFGDRKAPAEVAVVEILPPSAPDPTADQLAEIETVYARYGGVAHARVVARYWYGYPQLTPEQMRALAGLP